MRSLKLALLLCLGGGIGSSAAETFELQTATVADIQAAMSAGALSAEQLVRLCLARIEAYDDRGPRLNAVITVNPRALETARALDRERAASGPRSPLHGIPLLLKDNYDTHDLPTTGGSVALRESYPPDDAFTVARLRAAGAVVLAKVNLSELARSGVSISSLVGQTLNPYDLTRTPGGSSGGTGAGIAATFGIVGTGSDTGQSTRSPASANNLVGIRPTFGLISRDGIIPISYTQDTAGPITRYVADAAVMLDQLVGLDPADLSTWNGVGHWPDTYTKFLEADGLDGARIGLVVQLFGEGSHAEHAIVRDVTMRAVESLRQAGAEVLPVEIGAVAAVLRGDEPLGVSGLETRWALDNYFASLGPEGLYATLAEYVAAAADTHPPVFATLKRALDETTPVIRSPELQIRLERQARFRDALVAAMDDAELDALFYVHQRRLVVPTTPDPDQVERNGFMASSSGLPAITIPGGFSPPSEDAPIGVPIGVEFLGRPFSEGSLIRLAYSFEQHTSHRRSPMSTPSMPGERFDY